MTDLNRIHGNPSGIKTDLVSKTSLSQAKRAVSLPAADVSVQVNGSLQNPSTLRWLTAFICGFVAVLSFLPLLTAQPFFRLFLQFSMFCGCFFPPFFLPSPSNCQASLLSLPSVPNALLLFFLSFPFKVPGLSSVSSFSSQCSVAVLSCLPLLTSQPILSLPSVLSVLSFVSWGVPSFPATTKPAADSQSPILFPPMQLENREVSVCPYFSCMDRSDS